MENKISILHLEDQISDSILIKSLISKWFSQFDYYYVDDEAGFIEALQNKQVDVVLSDYELPDYSGSDALAYVKNHYPQIPFIFVTGKMGEDSAIESLLNGATDYVMKSKPERLVPAINRVLYEAELLKDRIASDKALRESEEKFRNLVENISDVIFEVDSEWKIQYISPVIEKILGYRPFELIGTHFLNIVHDPDKPNFTNILSELHEQVETSHEYRCIHRNGEKIWVRTSIKASFENGNFSGGSGTLIDINKRKQNEEALFKEQYLMEILMNIIPDHLYFKDLESKFIRISKSHTNSFGITGSREAIGKTDFDYFTEEHAREAFIDEQEIIRTGKIMTKEEKETWPDGSVTWVFTTKLPLRDLDGNIVGTFGISRDITERKRFEQELMIAKERAEASDRLKTAFMRNISHEIRTPLNGILGFGQLIAEPTLTKEDKEEYLMMLNDSSDRLINTVTNIMDTSLIVSGNQEVQKKNILLGEMMEEIYNRFRIRCFQKKLAFVLNLDEISPTFQVHSDPELLNKVLNHLIDNAVKYTRSGSIKFGCKTVEDQVVFHVTDTGIGINLNEQKGIFDHFNQGDGSYTREQEGSGLGLSIAKGLVELLGGRIWVESIKGEGSTFSFSIPNVVVKPDKTEAIRQNQVSTDKPFILIADDEEANSLLLERLLFKEGLEFMTVSDGQQAVEACRKYPNISLVFMDIKMPVMDGFEATRQIKQFNPALAVIALSAFALSGDEKRALDAGCNDYLTKPLRKDILKRKLIQYGAVK